MVVQADTLDKGGGEKESQRDGTKERWTFQQHRVVWCSKKAKEKEMAKQWRKGVTDTTRIGWRFI